MPTGHYQHHARAPRVTLICEACGKEFILLHSTFISRSKIGRIRYCSRECTYKSQVKPASHVSIPCDYCGTTFIKRSDHIREHNYCSVVCSRAAHKSQKPVRGSAPRENVGKWNDPEFVRQYMREYSKSKTQKQKRSEYIKAHSEARKLAQKRYRQTHKDEIRIASGKRRSAAKAGDLTAKQWCLIKQSFGNVCLCCGVSGDQSKLEIDHVIPLAQGGEHTASNIQPLCRSCNARKGDKAIDYRPVLRVIAGL